MTESLSSSPLPDRKSIDPVAEALGVVGEARFDVQAGLGRGYSIRSDDGTPLLYLETFERGIVRVTTPTSRHEVTGLGQPTVAAEGVVWEQAASFFSVAHTGDLTVHLAPAVPDLDRTNAPGEPSVGGEGPTSQVTPVPVFTADSSALQPHSPEPPAAQPEKEERVRVFGRLGQDPRFRLTSTNKLIGQFPLAVRVDEETVKWEKIVAIGPRAEKLQAELKLAKGQAVEVIGYRHKQKRKDRQGNERIVEEIYVVAVIPR